MSGTTRAEPSGSAQALSGLRVLEHAGDVAGPFCGKAFADLGADVIKIEPPSGDLARRFGPFRDDRPDPEASGRFSYLNTSKRGITLALDQAAGHAILRRLARTADVLLLDLPGEQIKRYGLDHAGLRDVNPRLVVTCVTPFGLTGPYRDYRATELVAYHAGGLGRETPYNQVTDLEREPPLAGGGSQASYLTGWTAAAATMAALLQRDSTGEGQTVDISLFESVASMLRVSLAGATYVKRVVVPRQKNGYAWVLPCQDGFISISPFNFDHWWERFKEMMGRPDWAEEEVFGNVIERLRNADVIESLTTEWLMEHTREEIYALALDHGVPCFPVHSMQEVFEAPHFAAREFFIAVEHPIAGRLRLPSAPARFSATPWRITRPAPRLGEHNVEVLCGELGLSRDELVLLHRTGVI